MKHLLFILIVSWNTAAAQSTAYAGYIRLGTMRVGDCKEVMERFAPGYTDFKNAFYGVGGEFEWKIKKYILDGELTILSHGPVNADTNFAEPFIAAATGKVGYTILEKGRFTIYPSVGAGISSFIMNTYTKNEGKKEHFQTAFLVQPTFDIGMNINWIVYYFKSTSPTGILPVGIRTGYRFSVKSDNWKGVHGTDLQPQPFSIGGYYLSIALGMGYHTGKR